MDPALLQIAAGVVGGGALVEIIRYFGSRDKLKQEDNEALRNQMLQYHQMMTAELNTVRQEHNERYKQTLNLQKELFEFERKYLVLEDERNGWKETAEKMKALYEDMKLKYEEVLTELNTMKQATKTLEKKVDANLST